MAEKNIKIANTEVQWVTNYKYLGVTLDKKLSFTTHIENKVKNARAVMSELYPLLGCRSKLSINNKLRIFLQIILPIILYACPVWANAAKTAVERIQRLQNVFLRMAMAAPWFVHGAVLRYEAGIPTIQERIYKIAENFFKNLENHPILLVHQTIQYETNIPDARKRPGDYLLMKPP